MKRFTDTQKWDDPWFWELSPTAKLLWFYLLDHCDNSGAVDYNPKIASFKIGQAVKPEHLAELQSRLKTLQSGKLWIINFIRFQFGGIEPTNNWHRSILKLLTTHGVNYPEDLEKSSPCQGAAEGLPSPPRQDKEKVRTSTGQEGVQGEGKKFRKPTIEEVRLLASKSGLPDVEADKFFYHYDSKGWKVGNQSMTSLNSAIAGWKTRWQANGTQPQQSGGFD